MDELGFIIKGEDWRQIEFDIELIRELPISDYELGGIYQRGEFLINYC